MRSDFPVNDALVLKAGYLIEFHAQSSLINIVCVCARIGNLPAKMRGYLMRIKVVGQRVRPLHVRPGTFLTNVDAAPDRIYS